LCSRKQRTSLVVVALFEQPDMMRRYIGKNSKIVRHRRHIFAARNGDTVVPKTRRLCSLSIPWNLLRALFIMNEVVRQHPVHHQSGRLEPHAFVRVQQQASQCLDAGVCTS